MPRAHSLPAGWHRVAVSVPAGRADDVAALCFELGSCGLEQHDQEGSSRLTAYFAADADPAARLRRLQDRLAAWGLAGVPLEVGRVDPEDWEVEWRRRFAPVQVTPRLWVHPSWIPVDPGPEGIAVVIDPRMAFGTGEHESTRLCLQALEEHLRPGAACLDLGTGSGVLAIVAARLGAARVLAVDTDPVAVANARDNVRLNGVSETVVAVQQGSLEQAGRQRFDLVLANIQGSVLRPLLAGLAALTSAAGTVVLSGLLAAEERRFAGWMRAAGLPPVQSRRLGEWVCLVGRRTG